MPSHSRVISIYGDGGAVHLLFLNVLLCEDLPCFGKSLNLYFVTLLVFLTSWLI